MHTRGNGDREVGPHQWRATSSARPSPHRQRTGIVVLCSGVAGPAAIATLWLHWSAPAPESRVPWLVLAVGFAVAEAVPAHVEHRREFHAVSLTALPLAVGLLYSDPLALVTARMLGSLVVMVVHRRQRFGTKLVVNTCVFWGGAAAAALVYYAAPASGEGPERWPWIAVAVVASEMLQALVIASAIALHRGERPTPAIVRMLPFHVIASSADCCFAVSALTLLRFEPIAIIPLSGVAVVLAFACRAYDRLRSRMVILRELHGWTARMSEGVLHGKVEPVAIAGALELLHAADGRLVVEEGGRFTTLSTQGVSRTSTSERAIHGCAQDRLAREGNLVSAHAVKGSHAGMLDAPIRTYDERALTMIIAGREPAGRPFERSDTILLGTIARQASAFLQNARLLGRLRDEAARREHQALHDPITGLPNRTHLKDRLEQRLRHGDPVAVVLIGLDRFREVNEALGYEFGELLLREVASRLRASVTGGETPASFGGDEFAVLLPGVCRDDALRIGAHLRAQVERPISLGGFHVDVGASVGVAVAPEDAADAALLLHRADIAMYGAKFAQSGVQAYAADRDASSPVRLGLVADLRAAIEQRDIEVWYQPQVALETGVVFGFEALARWCHPTIGYVPPNEFVELAEQTGLIRPLTRLVLDLAAAGSAHFGRRHPGLRVSVNISARTLLEDDFDAYVMNILAAHDLDPSMLCLEVTETSVMSDPQRSLRMLRRLHALGVTLAVDDFGTGHSTLAYLARLPVAELKIDSSFVFAMTEGGASYAIVDAIIGLADRLGLAVVAEGVETGQAADMLATMGCRSGQGYLYSPAVPLQDLEVLLAAERALPSPHLAAGNDKPAAASA